MNGSALCVQIQWLVHVFFHFLIETFISEVLGIDSKHRGLYGDTDAYYGTVEQQDRLTLYLHMLIWIKSGLSPQEM